MKNHAGWAGRQRVEISLNNGYTRVGVENRYTAWNQVQDAPDAEPRDWPQENRTRLNHSVYSAWF